MNDYYVKNGVAYITICNSDTPMLCDVEEWEKYKDSSWYNNNGYAQAKRMGRTVKLHRLIMNPPSDMVVDHINRNSLDNRKVNMRIVPQRVNMANRNAHINNRTGAVGVYWHKHRKKYYAEIKVNKKRYCLGTFEKLEDAIAARRQAEIKYRNPYIEKETLHAGCFFNK